MLNMENLGRISVVLAVAVTVLFAGIPSCACADCSHFAHSTKTSQDCSCCGDDQSSSGCCCQNKGKAATSAGGCSCSDQSPAAPAPLPNQVASQQLVAALMGGQFMELESLHPPAATGCTLQATSHSLLPADRLIALQHFLL